MLLVSGFVLRGQSVPFPEQARGKFRCATPDTCLPRRGFRTSMDRFTSTELYRMTYVAVPLIAGGLVVMGKDTHFRNLRNGYAPSFRHHYDDYLQYAPAAALLGLKIAGVEGRSSWGRMIVSDAFSSLLTFGTIASLKYTTKVMRPDGSNRHSFPSGHTATAFLTATMLHKEYGLTRSPWYSIGAYTAATATGLSRQLNNKHWLSDVMVGAGIGILSAELGYFLADLIFREKGIRREWLPEERLDRAFRPSFFGLYLGFSVMPGSYRLPDGSSADFSTGSSAGVEGAWFKSRYVGIGGRFTVSSLPLSRNGKAENEPLNMIAGYAGLYFSLPLSVRWLVGSKLLAGCNYALSCRLSDLAIGERAGLSGSTGLSLTYLANRRFGMKFFTDYTLGPSVAGPRGGMGHMLTLGGSVCMMF